MMQIGDILSSMGISKQGVTRQGTVAKRAFADYLRSNQTPSERMMARVLYYLGIDAEPQVPILGWIVDFYDRTNRVVIEVDGSIHSYQKEADAFRDEKMRAAGYSIIRIANGEVRHLMASVAADRAADRAGTA